MTQMVKTVGYQSNRYYTFSGKSINPLTASPPTLPKSRALQ